MHFQYIAISFLQRTQKRCPIARLWDHSLNPGGGTPYVMGDTYVPRFWPPFFTLAGLSTIFLGYFFSSTNTKTIFWGIKTTNFYRIRSFRPQISFFPRSFWVQFSAASGTPPSFFGPSTPPGSEHSFSFLDFLFSISWYIWQQYMESV